MTFAGIKMIIKLTALTIISVICTSIVNANEKPIYPELPMAEEYSHIANLMTEVMVEKVPETNGNKDPIIEFIYSIMSVNEFEDEMIKGYNQLADGHTNKTVRLSDEYTAELARCKSVSRDMALLTVSNAHDIYLKKVLRPDELTFELFSKSTSNETDQIISWIVKPVTKDEFQTQTKSDYDAMENDRIYYFNSPPFSWKMMFGREGYAIFRDGMLIKKVITGMS